MLIDWFIYFFIWGKIRTSWLFFTFNLQESLRNTLNSLVILASNNNYYHPTLPTGNIFTFMPIKLLNSQDHLFKKMWLNHFTWIIVEKVLMRETLLASWDVRSGPGFVLLHGSSHLCCWRSRLSTIGVRWRQSAAADIRVNMQLLQLLAEVICTPSQVVPGSRPNTADCSEVLHWLKALLLTNIMCDPTVSAACL